MTAVVGLPRGSHFCWGLSWPSFGVSARTPEVPDGHHDPVRCLVPVAHVFPNTEWLALAGSLVGYGGLTRRAYEPGLRQFASWCQQPQLRLFEARRADIECFAATWRPAAVPGLLLFAAFEPSPRLYPYAVEEELLDHSLAGHVRRPRLDYESHATCLDRTICGRTSCPGPVARPPGSGPSPRSARSWTGPIALVRDLVAGRACMS